MMLDKAGFVALLGRPNAGKSSLLNALCQDRLALVSHKANATRKRMQVIVIHNNAQIIFLDTPGIHRQESLLNVFMLNESMHALSDCDISLFIAPVHDNTAAYEEFLNLAKDRKHALIISKVDTVNRDYLLNRLAQYQSFAQCYDALIPLSAHNGHNLNTLLDWIAACLPESPAFFDTDISTTENLRSIYKEMIRESIFELTSDEIPYESDVLVIKFEELPHIDVITAHIVVRKKSQKAIVIGKNGSCIKRIGSRSREMMEAFGGKNIMLKLYVVVDSKWCKNKEKLSNFGYNFES